MKQFFIIFIYFSLTIFACFSQYIGKKHFFSKDFGDKYTTWQLKLSNKKSFVFCAKPNFSHNCNPKISLFLPKMQIMIFFLSIKTKKYAFLFIADKGLIRLYLFQARHFWQKFLQDLSHHLFQAKISLMQKVLLFSK